MNKKIGAAESSANNPGEPMGSFDLVQFIQITLNGVAAGCIYGLVALGFVLIYKATEMVNFAQGDLMMLGAFFGFATIGLFGLPFWAGALIAVLAMMVFGYALDGFVLRRVIGQPAFAIVMLTIGIGFILRSAASIIFGSDSKSFDTPMTGGVTAIGGLALPDISLAIIAGTLILCGLLYGFFRFTRLGLAMQAASQNQLAAYYMGIPVKRLFSLIWAISAGVAAVAGILLAPITLVDVTMGLVGIKAFAAAVLGGFGSIPGAVLGGIIIGVLEQYAGVFAPEGVKDVTAYVLLLLVLFIRPEGLFGEFGRKKV